MVDTNFETKMFRKCLFQVSHETTAEMSKQLEIPDPIELITPMVPMAADGYAAYHPAGNDLLFDESLCEQG